MATKGSAGAAQDVVRYVDTPRLRIACRVSGTPGRPVVILIHGNVSSSVFWDETMVVLAEEYLVVAPDLRGFGLTEARPIDATRGLRDWADDLAALLAALNIQDAVHLVGWSMGGGIVMQYAIDQPERVRSVTLVSPLSPYGFGGTTTTWGDPAYPDFAGSGGGTVSPEFVARLEAGEREDQDSQSPVSVMNQLYFRPPFRVAPDRERRFVESMLSTRIGPGFYPGSTVPSANWPGQAPGPDGVANAMSPRYVNLSSFAQAATHIPVLWIRGDADRIVSDASLLDMGTLGQLGAVPGWPGPEVFPPQPMVSQMRAVLETLRAGGGYYRELVVPSCGHSPHIERPEFVLPELSRFLSTGQ